MLFNWLPKVSFKCWVTLSAFVFCKQLVFRCAANPPTISFYVSVMVNLLRSPHQAPNWSVSSWNRAMNQHKAYQQLFQGNLCVRSTFDVLFRICSLPANRSSSCCSGCSSRHRPINLIDATMCTAKNRKNRNMAADTRWRIEPTHWCPAYNSRRWKMPSNGALSKWKPVFIR